MSETWPKVPLARVLTHRSDFITIDDSQTYKRCRVQVNAQGVVLRDKLEGAAIKTKSQQVCRAGEFLVAEIDAKVGGFGIVPPELDGAIVSSHYFLFGIDEAKLDRRFLDYYIRTHDFRGQVEPQGSTNYAAIRPAHVQGYRMPLPPLPEQRRIVARIAELAGRIAEAKGLHQEALAHESSLWESILVASFQKLATTFSTSKFGDVCDVVRGGSPRPAGDPTYYGGDIPFLKVGDLTADETMYVTRHTSTITEIGLPHTRQVEVNTLMLTNSGATLGVPKICAFPTTFNDGIQALLNIPDDLSKEYLYYFLRSKTSWFREDPARGQGQPNLNTQMVKDLSFPRPPRNIQDHTVRLLSKMHERTVCLSSEMQARSERIDALLPSILDKAFRGEL